MAILEIPYMFSRSGMRARQRAEEKADLLATVPVRVEQLEAEQAPLVARCSYMGHRLARGADGALLWLAAEIDTDYRLVGGQLCRRVVMERGFLGGVHTLGRPAYPQDDTPRTRARVDGWIDRPGDMDLEGAEIFLRALAQPGCPMPLLPALGQNEHLFYNRAAHDQDVFARRTGDDMAACASRVRRAFGGHAAFVDGGLYLPSRGPAWTLGANADASGMQTQACSEVSRQETGSQLRFWLPGDPALDEIRRKLVHDTEGSIEVVCPGSWQIHPDTLSLAVLMGHVFEHPELAGEMVESGAHEALHALADLMAYRGVEDAPVEEMSTAMIRLGNLCRRAAAGSHMRTLGNTLELLDKRQAIRLIALSHDNAPRPRA